MSLNDQLEARGILTEALKLGWVEQADGWLFPLFKASGTPIDSPRRWKCGTPGKHPKCLWKPEKKKGLSYYLPPGFLEAVKDAEGKAYKTSGEPDTLAMRSAGILNVFNWFDGESSIPPTFNDDLRKMGIVDLTEFPDLDDTGRRSAVALARVIDIPYHVHLLPDKLCEKGDLNKLWMLYQFDPMAFEIALAKCPEVDLAEWGLRYDAPAHKNGQMMELDDDYIAEIERALGQTEFNSQVWGRKLCRCPFHDDQQASAHWNHYKKILKCFVCAPPGRSHYLSTQVGEKLGVVRKSQITPINGAKTAQISEHLPAHPDLEQQLILLVLQFGVLVFHDVSLLVMADDFTDNRDVVWRAFEQLADRGAPIDKTMVSAELKDMGKPKVGEWVLRQPDTTYPAGDTKEIASKVRAAALRRRVYQAGLDMQRLALDLRTSADEVEIQGGRTFNAAVATTKSKSSVLIGESMRKYRQDVADIRSGLLDDLPGVKTGIASIDDYFVSWKQTDHVVIAGATGMGKSALGATLAGNVSEHSSVFFWSGEMSREQIGKRMMAQKFSIPSRHLQNPKLLNDRKIDDEPSEYERYEAAMVWLNALKLVTNDGSGAMITVEKLRSEVLKAQYQYSDLSLVIVDYLTLLTTERYGNNKVSQTTYIADALKNIAKDFHLTVLSLVQLSRSPANRGKENHRPALSDIRESGGIENSADIVMAIYRDAYYNKKPIYDDLTELLVLKYREGQPNTVIPMRYEARYVRFETADRRAYPKVFGTGI